MAPDVTSLLTRQSVGFRDQIAFQTYPKGIPRSLIRSKKRAPLGRGANLPWFSRCVRAWLRLARYCWGWAIGCDAAPWGEGCEGDCCVAPMGELPSEDDPLKAAKLLCINVTWTRLPRVAWTESDSTGALPSATR